MNFWPCRKNDLIKKKSFILKFMTSQPGSQTTAIHILSNISGSKSNQAMKLGQLLDYDKRNVFLQKTCRK